MSWLIILIIPIVIRITFGQRIGMIRNDLGVHVIKLGMPSIRYDFNTYHGTYLMSHNQSRYGLHGESEIESKPEEKSGQ